MVRSSLPSKVGFGSACKNAERYLLSENSAKTEFLNSIRSLSVDEAGWERLYFKLFGLIPAHPDLIRGTKVPEELFNPDLEIGLLIFVRETFLLRSVRSDRVTPSLRERLYRVNAAFELALGLLYFAGTSDVFLFVIKLKQSSFVLEGGNDSVIA